MSLPPRFTTAILLTLIYYLTFADLVTGEDKNSENLRVKEEHRSTQLELQKDNSETRWVQRGKELVQQHFQQLQQDLKKTTEKLERANRLIQQQKETMQEKLHSTQDQLQRARNETQWFRQELKKVQSENRRQKETLQEELRGTQDELQRAKSETLRQLQQMEMMQQELKKAVNHRQETDNNAPTAEPQQKNMVLEEESVTCWSQILFGY